MNVSFTMIRIIFSVLLFTCAHYTSSAQISVDFNNPPWEIGCDSFETQAEMNQCSAEELNIADSVLSACYDSLLNYVDDRYMAELALSDSSDKEHSSYLAQLDDQREAIIRSREDFQKFLSSTTDIIFYEYLGGSMRPMAVNTYALYLTVNQIKMLVTMMEELVGE